jgi:predicted dehydrogenase
MNENQFDPREVNRRDFLKGSSVATLMTMLGGVELARGDDSAPAQAKSSDSPSSSENVQKVKVAVIGLGPWGREIVNTLATLKVADIGGICDTYAATFSRCAKDAPNAVKAPEYKAILDNKDIRAVIVATPTHLHREIVLEALKAGKHVYCEAPIAHTIEDARTIALAAKAAPQVVFQAGLQLRSEPQRHFLLPYVRSGALGKFVMARAQWHKKQSWRAAAPNPEREKALNWRLDKTVSLGLIGEIGCHAIDQAGWFINAHPTAVTGWGSIVRWNEDGREVPDTVQAVFEYPGGVRLVYDATLANSFDAEYEVWYGSDSAIMLRDNKAWNFKEADSVLGGWELYARKDVFSVAEPKINRPHEETGIALIAGASKLQKLKLTEEPPLPQKATLAAALEVFLRNAGAVETNVAAAGDAYKDDPTSLLDLIRDVPRRPAAGYLEGFQATVLAVKANEAILGGKRIELKKESYELT